MDNLETNLNEIKNILNLSKKQIEDRKLSLLDFSKNGFPSKKDEDWKFIDLNRIISSKIPKIKFSNKVKRFFKAVPKFLLRSSLNFKGNNKIQSK